MDQIRKINFGQIVLALALLGLGVQLALSISIYARLASAAVAFPYPLDYGEGPLLDQTLRVASGENLYDNDFATPPYTISNYPPMFPLLQAPFALAFGPAFWYGRGLSVLSALLTALFVGLTLYTLTRDRTASAVGGLLLLAIPYIQYWSTLNRVDTLALVFSWAALLVVVRWPDRRWGIPLAAALLVASIFSRQSYALAAPFGAFVWLLFSARWRKALQLAAITGGATLALFLLLNLLTRGGFYLNIVTANVNPFYWDTVRRYFSEFFDNNFPLVLIILAFLALAPFFWRSSAWKLALPYLIAATASAATVGKDGSNVNYMFEFAAAISFAGGAALAWVGRNHWLKALVAVVLIVQVGMLADWSERNFTGRIMEKVEIEPLISSLYNRVRETEGIVLADEYMGLVPLAGKRLYYQPFEFKMMSDGGIWDQQPFLDSLEAGEYPLLALYFPEGWSSFDARWTPEMQAAVNRGYSRDTALAYTWLYRPRP